MRIKQNNLRSGMTLIELPIYMGLLTIFLLIFSTIISSTLDVFLRASTTGSVTQDGRYIYTRFLYDVGRAQSIEVPANLGDTGTTLTLTISGAQLTYSLTGSTLFLTDANGTVALHGQDTKITSLQFTRVGNAGGKHTIRMNFTIASNDEGAGSAETKTFQTAAGLR